MRKVTAAQQSLRSLVMLGLVGLGLAVVLVGINALTGDRIALEEDRRSLAVLTQIVAPERYDNELVRDRYRTAIPGLPRDATVFRARAGGEPVALLVDVVTPQGYSGDIRLLIGIDPQGIVLGVRVLAHRETPGLGDRIEIERSDWITGFDDRSLDNPEAGGWRTSRRGGDFDTLTNATITAQAIVDAVRRVLEWQARDPQAPFAVPAEDPGH